MPTTIYMAAVVDNPLPLSPLESGPTSVHTTSMHTADNVGALCAHHAKGYRIKLRLVPELCAKRSKHWTYERLHCRIALSCPTPEQAQLALDAIARFAASLDGIWLAPATTAPTAAAPTPGPNEPGEGDPDAQRPR